MRRTASEIICNLQSRVARLEKSASFRKTKIQNHIDDSHVFVNCKEEFDEEAYTYKVSLCGWDSKQVAFFAKTFEREVNIQNKEGNILRLKRRDLTPSSIYFIIESLVKFDSELSSLQNGAINFYFSSVQF